MNEIQLCYFAALCHGLRLINEKEKDLGRDFGTTEVDAGALIHFVKIKGDYLVHLHFGDRPIEGAKELPDIPLPEKRPHIFPMADYEKKIEMCSDSKCDRPATRKGMCSKHSSIRYYYQKRKQRAA